MKKLELRRLYPAIALLFLTPLVAEYLLGSLTFGELVLFPIMILMYGAGALFFRELARRNDRGWPTIIMLGFAYALIEEGLATQSLFNPHYLGLNLLEKGFIPSLGIGGPWSVYVIILHVAWSIAVPIALVESLFPEQRLKPWLGKVGFAISGALYVFGVGLIAFGTWQKERFEASATQLSITALIALVTAAAAFVLFRRVALDRDVTGSRRVEKALALAAFVAGSAFHLVAQFGSAYLSPLAAVLIELLLPISMLVGIRLTRRHVAWAYAYTDALMIGGLLAYCLLGFFLSVRLHGSESVSGQFIPVIIILSLIGIIVFRRIRKRNEMTAEKIYG